MSTFVCSDCMQVLDDALRDSSVRHLCVPCWKARKRAFRAERVKRQKRVLSKLMIRKACDANAYAAVQMYRDAKRRATKCKVPFTMQIDDIIPLPLVCPAMGTALACNDGRLGDNSFSLDRVVPSVGYTNGNIHVISYLANAIKRNATPDEVLAVALYAYTATGHTLPDIHAKVNEIAQRQVEYAKINAGTETVGEMAPSDVTHWGNV